MRQLFQLIAVTLGIVLMWNGPVVSPTAAFLLASWQSPLGASVDQADVWEDLVAADVVYLGETHDNPADHVAQLHILEMLYQRNPKMAIGLEMFQRPYQSILDRYLANEISETELQQQSQYEQRWGYPWEYYAPILRFAKAHGLPVLALNTPTEVTRQVAQAGLESLSAADRQWIPPLSEIRTDNAAYRQRTETIYQSIHQGHSASFSFQNFFLSQVLWDETMAETVANFLKTNPTNQVVVLAGQGHIAYGDGIPDRVARRMRTMPNFQQRSVLLNPDPVELSDRPIADYLWRSQP